ncbi:Major facilitator superfamily [Botryosphaeria dothidea]|uniref:Major facilitator superfamily n=1 Tax=Botryosphaeria dothidea TaxID=55169 RepID=A0A8H4N535_9PEZI|nr:Major facilitator superfamily [Botryosphaeria dothidea]
MAPENHDIQGQAGKLESERIEVVPQPSPDQPTKGVDKAAQFLQQANKTIVIGPEDDKRVLRKIDWAILPIVLVVYALQSLDKTSLSYAAVFGLIDDTNLVGDQYSWLGSIVYLAQLVMQPVVAVCLVKLPIGKFTAVMVFCWGATLCGMAAAKSFGGLMATRFLLGAFEASVAPAFIAIVQMWYRRGEQTNRNAAWYATLGVVNILGSLLSYGLGHIKSDGLHSYQIIFLFCGLLTVVIAVFVFFFLPDSPMEAKFLKGDDKLIAVERLRANQMGVVSKVWKWDHVWDTLLDLKTWLWFAMIMAISIPSGGVSTFGPLLIKSFGFDSFVTILLQMPFGAVQIISTLGGAALATWLKKKSPVLILLCIPPIVGIFMLMFIEYNTSNRGVLLFGYYLISVYPGVTPLIYSWEAQNTAGDTKKKLTTGILFVGASVGNVIGPLLYKPSEAPHYSRGLRSNLALFLALIVLICVTVCWIRILNAKHAKQRELNGKSAHVIDRSMEKPASNKTEELEGPQNDSEDKGFLDVTDLKNEDFIYLY